MLQSHLFTRTRREAPKDEVAKNAQLLIRAGFIHKEMAGVYSFLPLGLRVLRKVEKIIREEMDAIGGQEVLLTALQDPAPWLTSGRWSDEVIDVWFKTKLAGGGELGLGNTHEEALTALMRHHVHSYADLPRAVYQIQTKFRNELRARSGILRMREFLMKDLYSFSRSVAEHEIFYEKAKGAYHNVFARVGIGDITFLTFASGGSFSKYSHEFQTICEAGEDTVYVAKEKGMAINKEVYTDGVIADLGLTKEELIEHAAVEVGNIFSLGTRFSDALNLTFVDEQGEAQPVVMGCYGIGPGRLMGTVVEALGDEKGLVWPKSIAPFPVHIVRIGEDKKVQQASDDLYERMRSLDIEVLYDDRAVNAGEKFADADLIGIPYRAVVSEKTLAENKIEVKLRQAGETKMMTEGELIEAVK